MCQANGGEADIPEGEVAASEKATEYVFTFTACAVWDTRVSIQTAHIIDFFFFNSNIEKSEDVVLLSEPQGE